MQIVNSPDPPHQPLPLPLEPVLRRSLKQPEILDPKPRLARTRLADDKFRTNSPRSIACMVDWCIRSVGIQTYWIGESHRRRFWRYRDTELVQA